MIKLTVYTLEDFRDGKFDQDDTELIDIMCTRDLLTEPISIPKKYRPQVDGEKGSK